MIGRRIFAQQDSPGRLALSSKSGIAGAIVSVPNLTGTLAACKEQHDMSVKRTVVLMGFLTGLGHQRCWTLCEASNRRQRMLGTPPNAMSCTKMLMGVGRTASLEK